MKQHSTPGDVIAIVAALTVGMFLGYFAAIQTEYTDDTPAMMMEDAQ
mgnify:CR=1 FL=1